MHRSCAWRDQGLDPASAEVQELAKEWARYADTISAGDHGMQARLAAFYRADPDGGAARLGVERGVIEYVSAARRAARMGYADKDEDAPVAASVVVRRKS